MPKMEQNIFQFRAIISRCGIFGIPIQPQADIVYNTINVIISARMNKHIDFLTDKKIRKDLYKYIIFLLNINVFFVSLD